MEKKTHEELRSETPGAWREPSAPVNGRTPIDNHDEADAQSSFREMIARRAYELYEERGRVEGDALNDWLRAEIEIYTLPGTADQTDLESTNRQRQSAAASGRTRRS